ncbi:hypothetical protein V1505DRAFT_382059 [Lipomyces doorenjongii]
MITSLDAEESQYSGTVIGGRVPPPCGCIGAGRVEWTAFSLRRGDAGSHRLPLLDVTPSSLSDSGPGESTGRHTRPTHFAVEHIPADCSSARCLVGNHRLGLHAGVTGVTGSAGSGSRTGVWEGLSKFKMNSFSTTSPPHLSWLSFCGSDLWQLPAHALILPSTLAASPPSSLHPLMLMCWILRFPLFTVCSESRQLVYLECSL